MNRKVAIDTEECIGCGSCHDLCPDVFHLDEEIEKDRLYGETSKHVAQEAASVFRSKV